MNKDSCFLLSILQNLKETLKAAKVKKFSEEAVLNIIGNTLNDNSIINGNAYNCNFNPLDKVIEVY
ncbi:hypothetical protein NJT12_20100 [Flavobacterium sp. AC]|uniref:Uncharacterized protein n=1 Tax=Flavobacterium azizsancarii TaxID=2961580 RepID=A0ABT4WH62_9FLAO|nr:hypothetical protein [Flavobacterium azizsancarii]MDA6071929.1 hypothetical protein [Flavobacterium azizsancarii]